MRWQSVHFWKLKLQQKAKEKDRKRNRRRNDRSNFHGMLTQTIWQTLNMPIRGETNYSSMSFMIPPLSLSVSHSLWVQKSSQHCHGAGGLGGFSKPFDSTTYSTQSQIKFWNPNSSLHLYCLLSAAVSTRYIFCSRDGANSESLKAFF